MPGLMIHSSDGLRTLLTKFGRDTIDDAAGKGQTIQHTRETSLNGHRIACTVSYQRLRHGKWGWMTRWYLNGRWLGMNSLVLQAARPPSIPTAKRDSSGVL